MIVYLTAWLAVAAYFAALAAPPQSSWRTRLWTAGCGLYLLHVAAAFHFVHHWDHAVAVRETSRRAEELTGSPAPQAIYFNHLFTLVWTLDAAWVWLAAASYDRRPRWVTWTMHGFLLFIVVNATIVFAPNPQRWLGVAALTATAVIVLRRIALAAPGRFSPR